MLRSVSFQDLCHSAKTTRVYSSFQYPVIPWEQPWCYLFFFISSNNMGLWTCSILLWHRSIWDQMPFLVPSWSAGNQTRACSLRDRCPFRHGHSLCHSRSFYYLFLLLLFVSSQWMKGNYCKINHTLMTYYEKRHAIYVFMYYNIGLAVLYSMVGCGHSTKLWNVNWLKCCRVFFVFTV